MQFTKQLPIGVSTFSRFAQENLIYVDKTKDLFSIANKAAGKFFLLFLRGRRTRGAAGGPDTTSAHRRPAR